jgi:hypothetical protein
MNLRLLLIFPSLFFSLDSLLARSAENPIFRFRDGLVFSAGISRSRFLNGAGTGSDVYSGQQAFSWGIAYQNTRSLSRGVGFSYGFLVSDLTSDAEIDGPFVYTTQADVPITHSFTSGRKKSQVLFVGLGAQFLFYLNPGSSNRFFLSPGAMVRTPLYTRTRVSGIRDGSREPVSVTDPFLNDNSPFLFISPELAFGYERRFGEKRMLRTEAVVSILERGRFRKDILIEQQAFIGLRIQYYFRSSL